MESFDPARATVRSTLPPLNPALGWIALIVGTAAGAMWVPAALKLSERLPNGEVGPSITLFDLLVFGPLIAMAVILGLLSRRPVLRAGDRPATWTLVGLCSGVFAIGAVVGLTWLSGGIVAAPNPAPVVPNLLVLGTALTVLQAGAEEVLFRGWLQPALMERIGVPAGLVGGAVIFAAFHAISAASNPISLVNLVLGGLWFGLLAWRSGGILAPLAAHFAYNVIEDCGLGLVPNGPNEWAGPLGALHDMDLVGQPLWGSTGEGLNASLGLTAVLLALVLPLLARQSRSTAGQVAATGPLPDHRLV